jgi:hypothetical protein
MSKYTILDFRIYSFREYNENDVYFCASINFTFIWSNICGVFYISKDNLSFKNDSDIIKLFNGNIIDVINNNSYLKFEDNIQNTTQLIKIYNEIKYLVLEIYSTKYQSLKKQILEIYKCNLNEFDNLSKMLEIYK